MIKRALYIFFPFFTGLISGLIFFSFGATGFDLEYFPGDMGDARFNMYVLEHGWLFLSGKVNSFWGAAFMYPVENVITFSDNFLGGLPFYAVFRMLDCDRETSFQLWFIFMSVLNYTTCYFFLRFLFKNNYAAACGAMIFAFSIALYSQIGHAQTFPRFMIPLAFWAGLLFVDELRVKFFFLSMLCVVYQLYCGFYLGFMLAVPIGLLFALSVWYKKGLYELRIKNVRWIIYMCLSVVVTVLLLIPLVLPYMKRAEQTSFYYFDQVRESLPTLVSYVYSHTGTLLWNGIDQIGIRYVAFWDHQIFPGGVAIVAVLVSLIILSYSILKRKSLPGVHHHLYTKIILLCGLATFFLFIRFGNFTFYAMVFPMPGFGAMRALQRIINVDLLFMAIAVAFLFNQLLSKNTWLSLSVFILVVTLIIIDNRVDPHAIIRERKIDAQNRIEELVKKIGSYDANTILAYEPDSVKTRMAFYQLDAMLAKQSLGIKTLNAYTATCPPAYTGYWTTPNEKNRVEWLQKNNLSAANILVVK